jgi:hypothetical protein
MVLALLTSESTAVSLTTFSQESSELWNQIESGAFKAKKHKKHSTHKKSKKDGADVQTETDALPSKEAKEIAAKAETGLKDL